jgi:hypothetical protein
MQSINKSVKGLSSSMKGLIAGAAVGFGIRGIASGMQEMVDAADDIGKMSKRIGVTAVEMQQLSFAARRVGADVSAIEPAFRKMSRLLLDAERGSSTAVDALARMGLKLKDLQGLSTHEQFELMGQSLAEMTDKSMQAALAQEAFGRSGTKIIPLIAEYEGLNRELEQLGTITNENVQAAEDYKDAVEDMTTAMKAAASNSGFIPFLTGVAEGMSALVQEEGTLRTALLGGIFSTKKEGGINIAGPDKKAIAAKQAQIDAKRARAAERTAAAEKAAASAKKKAQEAALELQAKFLAGVQKEEAAMIAKVAKERQAEQDAMNAAIEKEAQSAKAAQEQRNRDAASFASVQGTLSASVTRFLTQGSQGGGVAATAKKQLREQQKSLQVQGAILEAINVVSDQISSGNSLVPATL